MNIFTCEKLTNNITSIMDPAGVRAFLVEGLNRAALIDTCCGYGNLKEEVDKLTSLTLTVICTHGHVDHAGGAYAFDEVYLNENDWNLVKEHTTIEKRLGFVKACGVETATKDDLIPQRDGGYLPLLDGQLFDLGGITLECIQVKGHTQGMTCILIKEIKTLILGDACNPFTYMFLPESSKIPEYINNLNALLKEHGDEFDTVWISHGEAQIPKSAITTVIDTCHEILNRTDDAVPFDSMGRKCFIAKKMDDNGRIDGKIGNVVYGLDKL